uniref:Uncharacterized protein n=1 Tax=Acrobeloides nanus TaxID=290746 RepID=A0A914C1W0_9BILA
MAKIKKAKQTFNFQELSDEDGNLSVDEEINNDQESDATSSDEADNESDRELQIAFKQGLLSKGLVAVKETKRPAINQTEEMKQKLFQIHKNMPWVNTLDITASPDLVYEDSVSNDFEREAFFYKQAQSGALVAIQRLQKLKVPVFRPSDYYAEMAKSDSHMDKVRRKLLDIQKTKERRENVRRLREEKKFATKVQKAELERRRTDKKKLMEAVKKHRVGMKSQLEAMLNNATKIEAEEEESRALKPRFVAHKGKQNRSVRNKKFGFGGQKKRSKQNNKESVNDVFGSSKGRKRPMKSKMKRHR